MKNLVRRLFRKERSMFQLLFFLIRITHLKDNIKKKLRYLIAALQNKVSNLQCSLQNQLCFFALVQYLI